MSSTSSVTPAAVAPLRLLRLREVVRITGLSAASIYVMSRDGKFPMRRKLGPRASAWRSDEVEQWCASRPRPDPSAPPPIRKRKGA